MKILFDQNTPRPLARYLTKHAVTLARHIGLDEVQNGDLIRAAEAMGFEVMVTGDKNIGYQQNLTDRKIAIVVLPSGQWPEVQKQLQEVIKAIDVAMPGSYMEISPRPKKSFGRRPS